MIKIDNLTKKFNSHLAVSIPALEIKRSESFGLVGNNGAGKTTLFRMLLDLIRPSSGLVTINDEAVKGNVAWKKFTGSYLDEGFLIGFLTPDEYFSFVSGINGINKAECQERLGFFTDFFNGEILDNKKYIRDLSKGNQKKVGIAAAMLTQPEVLVLDEPFANLDPSTQIRLKGILKEYQSINKNTLLVSSHDLSHVTEVCERIVVLEKGEIIKDITTGDNTLNELEAYFTH